MHLPISRRFFCLLTYFFILTGASYACAQEAKVRNVTNAASAPVLKSTVQVSGLKQPAEILIDRWGVPHIYAASQDDVFFAQGFNAARDRLFQIDLWRRRCLGLLSSVFGPAYVEQDRATRLFLYRGDMKKEWLAYGKDAERIAGSFVAGINAYIDHVNTDAQKLPFEFPHFGYAPEKWRAEDVVRIRSHGLTRNLTSEVARSHVACKADLKADHIRTLLSPKWETRLPTGFDPCLPVDLLRVFQLATQGVAINTPAGGRADGGNAMELLAMDTGVAPLEGSNAWVIAPAKSASGRAMLASDPHRAHSAPSLRYIAHLSAPGLDVVGAGEPALPGISIGHNGTIAFGLTIFGIDQEDLYTYELNPANAMEYKYQGKWEKFVVQKEQIPVKGAATTSVELLFTRHGPIIYIEKEKNRAFAVRSAWFEAGMAPYFGSIQYMYAKNFTEFKRSMLHWGAPTENQVYADVMGNIGWVTGGLTPIRPNWDGLLPVPGDGRHEWSGFLAGDQLPFSYNPKSGWFASANEMNLPAGYPYAQRKLGFEWSSDERYSRLKEVLSRPGKLTIEDSMRLQNDLLSIPARRVIGLLKGLTSTDARTQAAMKMLSGWNFIESTHSPEAALFEVWWSRYLGYLFKETVLGRSSSATMGAPDTMVLLDGLERPESIFGADAIAKRNWVLLTSLTLAWVNTEKLLGTDPRQWQWGKLHQSLFIHPFSPAVDDATRARLNVGPFPKDGSSTTVNLSSYNPNNYLLAGGPAFRVVVDVGNWDNSRAVNSPGQSGNPDNPHYRDLADKWLKGEYFPLLYSRKMIEAATTEKIELLPRK
ncbi:MAG: penicillin acylase family protein [Burkholderiales bacterium]|nr:penicillin acylase family protein [Burkholderiales bacterium]